MNSTARNFWRIYVAFGVAIFVLRLLYGQTAPWFSVLLVIYFTGGFLFFFLLPPVLSPDRRDSIAVQRRFWLKYKRRLLLLLLLGSIAFYVGSFSAPILMCVAIGYGVYGMFIYDKFHAGDWMRDFAQSARRRANVAEVREQPPVEVHFKREEHLQWFNPEEIEKLTSAMLALGFVKIGDFSVEKLAGRSYRAFYHPGEDAWGSISAKKGIASIGLTIVLETGQILTCTNFQRIRMADPPWVSTYRDATADAARLWDMLLQQAGDFPRRPATPEQYVQLSEERFRKWVQWFALRGGVTREDLLQLREEKKWTDEQFNQTVRLCRRDNLLRLEQLHIREFFASGQITPERAASLKGRLILVHDMMQMEDCAWPPGTLEAASVVPFSVTPMREAFRLVNVTRPERDRHELIGHVDMPIPADLYIRPAHVGDAGE